MLIVDVYEASHGRCECHAEPAKGETDLQQQAVLIVLSGIETW